MDFEQMEGITLSSISLTNQSSQREIAENRIAKISAYLRVGTGCVISLNIFMLMFLAAWLFWLPTAPDESGTFEALVQPGSHVNFLTKPLDSEFSMRAKLLMLGRAVLIGLYVVYCFSRIHGLFGNFRDKNIFIKRNSKLLRSLGYALIIGLVFSNFIKLGIVIAAGALDTPGLMESQFKLSFKLSSSDILSVLMIGMVFLSAWILDIGRELYTDAEFTI